MHTNFCTPTHLVPLRLWFVMRKKRGEWVIITRKRLNSTIFMAQVIIARNF
jgi:hypothetical protein